MGYPTNQHKRFKIIHNNKTVIIIVEISYNDINCNNISVIMTNYDGSTKTMQNIIGYNDYGTVVILKFKMAMFIIVQKMFLDFIFRV